MIQPWIALIGVITGFLLGEGSRYARYRWQIRRNKNRIRADLQALLAQIPQKQDILRQALRHLRRKAVLPMLSVRALPAGYLTVLADVYPHLDELQRNCLHVIYGRLKVADDFMDNFEDRIVKAVQEAHADPNVDPWPTYAAKVREIDESYKVVVKLIRSYLDQSPIDVFGVKSASS